MTSLLETQGLTRRFGDLTAVDRLTMSVEAGEVFALLGANGAGKTVTMKMLTTLLRPTAGNARVAGFDVVHHAAQVRRVIGRAARADAAGRRERARDRRGSGGGDADPGSAGHRRRRAVSAHRHVNVRRAWCARVLDDARHV